MRDKENFVNVASLVFAILTFFGITVSTVTPSNNYFVVAILVAIGMAFASFITVIGNRLLLRNRFSRSISNVETNLTVVLDMMSGDISSGQSNTKSPTGYLSRRTWFKARKNLSQIERYYLAYDPISSELNFEENFDLRFELECTRKGQKGHVVKDLNVRSSVSQFRKVILDLTPADKNTFSSYDEFVLSERMRTSGNFDMREEFYVWTISEPMKASTFRILFEGIEVDYVEHEIKTGIQSSKSKSLDKKNVEGKNQIQVFTFNSKNLRVGDKHIFRWRYSNPSWPCENVIPVTTTVL